MAKGVDFHPYLWYNHCILKLETRCLLTRFIAYGLAIISITRCLIEEVSD